MPTLRDVGCPICGTPAGGDAVPPIAENGFTAWRCEPCGLLFVSPRPAASAVLGIYEHDASQTAARVHVAKTRDPYALAHARHVLGLLLPHLAQSPAGHPPHLLEIGAGGGVLLDEARSQGFAVAAIEPNPVLADFIRARGIACEQAPVSAASFGGRPHDVIVHCNVLSHFDDPVGALREMTERLGRDGLIALETGNFADVDRRYHALIAATERFQLPEHLTFFGERSLVAALRVAGLEPIAIHRYSRMPEKRGPAILRALGLGRLTNRLRFWLKYQLGAWAPKRGRPQTILLIARRTDAERHRAATALRALTVLLGAGLIGCLHRAEPRLPDEPASTVSLPPPPPVIATLPTGPVREDTDDAVVGDPAAPMAVLEFSDVQCPFCGPAYGQLSTYVKQHADVRLVVKHYPISGQCNPNVEGDRHEHACAAARAVICANQQGQFDALASRLYANQTMLSDPEIAAFAAEAGLLLPRFSACVADPATDALIHRDVEEAEVAGVQGTPTIYVYGAWGPRWVQVHGGAPAVIAVLDAARAHHPLPPLSPG